MTLVIGSLLPMWDTKVESCLLVLACCVLLFCIWGMKQQMGAFLSLILSPPFSSSLFHLFLSLSSSLPFSLFLCVPVLLFN